MERNNRSGFTLIELLIVVAIVAILAAIAIPNFLEAQTRSKVSASKAQMRGIGTALEAYRTDYNAYPPFPYLGASDQNYRYLGLLSSPIAYITDAKSFRDPFWLPQLEAAGISRTVSYRYGVPMLVERGVGLVPQFRLTYELRGFGPKIPETNQQHNDWGNIPYDPTNGTVSIGCLIIIGPFDGYFGPRPFNF